MKRSLSTEHLAKRRLLPAEYTCTHCERVATRCDEGNVYKDGRFVCVGCLGSADVPPIDDAVTVVTTNAQGDQLYCAYTAGSGAKRDEERPAVRWDACVRVTAHYPHGEVDEHAVVDGRLRCGGCDDELDPNERDEVMIFTGLEGCVKHLCCVAHCAKCDAMILDKSDAECVDGDWVCSDCCIGRCDCCGEEMALRDGSPVVVAETGERLCSYCKEEEEDD